MAVRGAGCGDCGVEHGVGQTAAQTQALHRQSGAGATLSSGRQSHQRCHHAGLRSDGGGDLDYRYRQRDAGDV
ncbi:hypothetical protein D3C72_2466420 [compost metagenome]